MRAEGEGCMVPCSASLRTCVQVAHIHLWVCPCLGTAMTVTSLGPLMWKVQVNLVRWVHKYGICEQWFLFSTWGNNLNWGWQLKTTIFLPSYEVCFWFPILSPGDRNRYNIFIFYKIFKHLQRANTIFFLLFFPSFFGPHCAACWRRQWHPTPVLLPGKSHGWRSLVGCSPWGC